MAESSFTTAMEDAVTRGVGVDGMQIVVGTIEKEETPVVDFVRIDFHLEGPGASSAGFTYTFFSDVGVEENLAGLADFVRKRNAAAIKTHGAVAAGNVSSS